MQSLCILKSMAFVLMRKPMTTGHISQIADWLDAVC